MKKGACAPVLFTRFCITSCRSLNFFEFIDSFFSVTIDSVNISCLEMINTKIQEYVNVVASVWRKGLFCKFIYLGNDIAVYPYAYLLGVITHGRASFLYQHLSNR